MYFYFVMNFSTAIFAIYNYFYEIVCLIFLKTQKREIWKIELGVVYVNHLCLEEMVTIKQTTVSNVSPD